MSVGCGDCFGISVRLSSLEESVDLLRLRRHLASLKDIAVFVAKRDRDLSSMLIDSKV